VAKLLMQYNNEIMTYCFIKLNKRQQSKSRKLYRIYSRESSNYHLECFFLDTKFVCFSC
jgi:hypothetical protein